MGHENLIQEEGSPDEPIQAQLLFQISVLRMIDSFVYDLDKRLR